MKLHTNVKDSRFIHPGARAAILVVLFLAFSEILSAQLVISAGPDISVCEGFSSKITVTYKGAKTPIRFSWSPSIGLNDATSPTPIVSPVQPQTTYIVTATDANGEVASDTILVTLNPRVYADAGTDIQACVGARVFLGASSVARGGTPPYTFDWLYLPPNASPRSDEHPSFIPQRSGYGRYIVHVKDSVGCDAWDTVEVRVNQPLTLKIGSGNAKEDCAFMQHNLGGLGISGGGVAPYQYRWTPSRGLSSPVIPNPTAFPDTTTMYVLTVTDALGCTLSDSVLVKVKPRMHARLQRKFTVCPNTELTLAPSDFISGGVGPYRYKWETASGQNISNDSIANPTTTPDYQVSSGAILYSVTVTDAQGCEIRDTVIVNMTDPPGANFYVAATVCQNDSVIYSVSGLPQFVYSWSVDGGVFLSNPNSSTVYVQWTRPGVGSLSLVVYDPLSNCTSTGKATTYVNPLPQPKITVIGVTTICLGSGVTTILDAGPGFIGYGWSSGENTQRIVVSRGGTYYVKVQDSVGCRNRSEPVVIKEVEQPKPVISGPAKICGGVKVQLHATPGFKQYAWNTGETDSVITISGPGNYQVSVSDSLGCTGISDPYTVDPRPVMVTTGGDPHFDAVETGLTYPTKEVFYKNTTTEDLVIDTLSIITTNIDLVVRSVRVGSTNVGMAGMHGYRVKPGESIFIEIEFNPTVKDVNTYELLLKVVEPCSDVVSIKGNLASYDKQIWATASIPNTTAKPGERFEIPLSIQFDSPQDSVEDATLYLSMRVNGYQMDIVDDAAGTIVKIDTLPSSWKVLHMRFDHLTIKYSAPYLLNTVRGLALASKKLVDTVFLDDRSVRWEAGSVPLKKPKVRTRNGLFTLDTYCYPHDLVWFSGGTPMMSVQPNPVSDELRVIVDSQKEEDLRLELFAPDGRLLKSSDYRSVVGASTFELDVNDISSGVYPLILRNASGSRALQVVICK